MKSITLSLLVLLTGSAAAARGRAGSTITRKLRSAHGSASTAAASTTETSYSSSSTVFYPGDSAGTTGENAACGGADLNDVFSSLAALEEDVEWFPVAIAQSMAQPLSCSSANETTGAGSPSVDGAGYANVLHAYCGICVQFTTSDGATAGGLVMDTCPNSGNSQWCPMDGGTNDEGYYNHLDFFAAAESDVTDVLGTDNPHGTIEIVACPDGVTDALTTLADANDSADNDVCTFWWDSDDSTWQGSPGMDAFGCLTCS